jgi:hypothetical protein
MKNLPAFAGINCDTKEKGSWRKMGTGPWFKDWVAGRKELWNSFLAPWLKFST